MFFIFTHVMKPVRNTNSEPGLPVMGSGNKGLQEGGIRNHSLGRSQGSRPSDRFQHRFS